MAYKIHIVDESGAGIGGTISFYDADGLLLGKSDIPVQGADAPPDFVAASTTFQIDSPGYVGYAVLSLNDWNEFTMVKDHSSKTVLFVIAIAVLLLAGKIIKG